MFSNREKIFQSKRTSRFSGINVFRPKIIQNVSIFVILTSSSLTPYYSYRAQEICSTSHLSVASRPAAGNTCVSMRKIRKMSPKSHQNDGFQVEFLKFFRKPQGGLNRCSIMYFSVLELWEAALNDPGLILNELQKPQKIMIFLKIFGRKCDEDTALWHV